MTTATPSASLPATREWMAPRHSKIRRAVAAARTKPLGAVCGVVLVLLIGFVLIYPEVSSRRYDEGELTQRLQGTNGAHIFGTDELGRDVLTRVAVGARISLRVGFGAVLVSMLVATGLGVAATLVGGWTDAVAQRLVDAVMSFPTLLLALTIVGMFGNSTVLLIGLIGFVLGIGQSRVVRSRVLSLKEETYILSARATGASEGRVALRHILPNTVPVLIVLASFAVSQAIIIEASLSFLGFGVRPPMPSLGGMLSGSGIQYMLVAPWIAIWPGLFLSIVVFTINMVGDALRDLLDPQLRNR
jgi:peptide/nickel transport system permease protein